MNYSDEEKLALIDFYAMQISNNASLGPSPEPDEKYTNLVRMADRLFELARSLPKVTVS